MSTRIDGRDGWIEVTRDGLHLLAKGDASLAEWVEAALGSAGGDDLVDVVTDELTSGGVRRTPDFALVDETSGRVLVRGTASVTVTGAEGTRTVLAPARGPWTDEDLEGGSDEVVLATGEPEPVAAAPDVEEPAAEEPVDDAPVADEPAAEQPASDAPAPEAPEQAAAPEAPGWAIPSVFAAEATSAQEPSQQEPVEEGRVVETPAPEAQDLVEPEPQSTAPTDDPPAAATAPGAPAEDEEELPSFDFLFGTTHSHRSSLLAGMEEDEAQAEAIDSGPVAAAGGYQPSDNPANATLAPPSEEDELDGPAEPAGPTVGELPGGLPPMPGGAPFAADDSDTSGDGIGYPAEEEPGAGTGYPATPAPEAADEQVPSHRGQDEPTDEEPAAAAPIPAAARAAVPAAPSGVMAARDTATGREPGGGRPQFVDGHLVGSRVPEAAAEPSSAPVHSGPGAAPVDSGPAAAAAPTAPGSSAPEASDGLISSVPWAGDGGAPAGGPAGPNPGVPGLPFGLPGLPTPDQGAAVQPEPTSTEGEQPGAAEPMVLAVRCSVGHLNAPHATRCRVCGQDLPSQQPEQTARPALGHLRLSTGDVVTLDRGVLIGRAPRADVTGPRTPHLVRISSPDNEISRNHVEIVLDGWHVLVRDLGSTNGTTVALPGSSPVRVRPGDQQTIEPGTTITLADQVSMVFEVTG